MSKEELKEIVEAVNRHTKKVWAEILKNRKVILEDVKTGELVIVRQKELAKITNK